MPAPYATTRLWVVPADRLAAAVEEVAARRDLFEVAGELTEKLRRQRAALESIDANTPALCPVCAFPLTRAVAEAAAVLLRRDGARCCPCCGVKVREQPPASFAWAAELTADEIDQVSAMSR